MTAGFATTDISDGESAAQKASGVDDLRETRSLLPFPSGELRAVQASLLLLIHHSIQELLAVKPKKANANLLLRAREG